LKRTRLFLDTTVLLSGILKRNTDSWRLLNLSHGLELVTNAFAIKEMRWVLKSMGYDAETINALVDFIGQRCRAAKAPKKEELMKYQLRDKNDSPIVCSAVKERCDFLVTEDKQLREDVKKYIPAVLPEELIQRP
jgi:predicted nucleic acid-binding protein